LKSRNDNLFARSDFPALASKMNIGKAGTTNTTRLGSYLQNPDRGVFYVPASLMLCVPAAFPINYTLSLSTENLTEGI
jgi:hypothetical protein